MKLLQLQILLLPLSVLFVSWEQSQFSWIAMTLCMNTKLIKKKITKKTKAIVPVHFTGYMTNMIEINKIAKKYKIPVVEDTCQSILASINNKNSGTWSNFGAFSLHPLKNINVWSDGGIIVTSNKKYAEKIKIIEKPWLN